jgi:hypothetical protein
MTTRYFSGTNGAVTVFRASATKVYNSATFKPIAFSSAMPFADRFPVSEIAKSEYDALVARKVERVKSSGADPKHATSPQDSWV